MELVRKAAALERDAEGQPVDEEVEKDFEAQVLIADREVIGERDEIGELARRQ